MKKEEKKQILSKIPNEEKRLLLSKVLDKYLLSEKKQMSTHTKFLDEIEYEFIKNYLTHLNISYYAYKVIEEANKRIIFFKEIDSSVITTYKIINKNKLRHQDILGVLFSNNLDQNTIGDIFVEEDYIYFSILSEVKHLLNNLTTIRNYSIKLEETSEIKLKEEHFELLSINVTTPRLDNVISKLTNKSRNQTVKYLNDRKVLLNYQEIIDASKRLNEGDILSLRGYGKYRIEKLGITTRSNKEKITILQYK